MYKCERCNKIFKKISNYKRHENKPVRCVDVNKYEEKITYIRESYENRISELQQNSDKLIKNLMEEKKMMMETIQNLQNNKITNNNTTINNVNNVNNNVNNNVTNYYINPTVAFGHELSDHVTLEELIDIHNDGHPNGTRRLIKIIYGHESNKGTIHIKNKRKGIFNVSDGKGGVYEMKKQDVSKMAGRRLIEECNKVISHINSQEVNNVGQIVDLHMNTNNVRGVCNSTFEKKYSNFIANELLKVI